MTMKTKKTLAAVAVVLLALCLVFAAPVSADDTRWNNYYAASWDDLLSNITSINEAVAAGPHDAWIYITADIDEELTSDTQRIIINDNAYVVLDLQYHNVNIEWNTTAEGNAAIFKIGNETPIGASLGPGAILEVWRGQMSLSNGENTRDFDGTSSLFFVRANSTVWLCDGEFTAPAFVASGNGKFHNDDGVNAKYANSSICVDNATLTSEEDVAIYMAAPNGFLGLYCDNGEPVISGEYGGIEIRAGELLMVGGNVYNNGVSKSPSVSDTRTGESTNTGSGITLSWDDGYKKPVSLMLLGGKVWSNSNPAIINLMEDGATDDGYATILIDDTALETSNGNSIVSGDGAAPILVEGFDGNVDWRTKKTDDNSLWEALDAIFAPESSVQETIEVLLYPGVNQSFYDENTERNYDVAVWTGSTESYTLKLMGNEVDSPEDPCPFKLMSGFTATGEDKAVTLEGNNILLDGNDMTITFQNIGICPDIVQPFYIYGNNVIVDNVTIDASAVSPLIHLWTVGVNGTAVNITNSEIKAGTATSPGSFAINIGLWGDSTGATISGNTLTMGSVTPTTAVGNEVSTAVYAYGDSYEGLTISRNVISGTDEDTLNAALTIGDMDSSAVAMTQDAPITISGNTITLKEGTIAGLNTSALVFSTAANAGYGQYWINTGSNTLSGIQLFFVGYSMKTDSLPKSTVNGTESQGGLSGIVGLEKPADGTFATLMERELPLDVSTLSTGTKYRLLDINVNGSVTPSGFTGMGVNVTVPTDNIVYYKAPVTPPASTPTYTPSTSPTTKPTEPETPVEPETPSEPVAGEPIVETEVTDGGEVSFETPSADDETGEPGDAPAEEPAEPEITGVVLPTGTDSEVAFIPISEQPAPAGKEENTKKVFEINVPTYEKGKPATIKFTMTVAELTADGKEAADVALWHFDEETGEWTKLVTTFTIVDGIVYFEAITFDFSPFAIIYEDEPVEEPTEEPTETPAPLFAVLAALGAAVVLRRK